MKPAVACLGSLLLQSDAHVCCVNADNHLAVTLLEPTLAQIVMESFLRISLPPWQRRMLTRLVAMVPAAVVAGVAGNRGAGKLLVLSQASTL